MQREGESVRRMTLTRFSSLTRSLDLTNEGPRLRQRGREKEPSDGTALGRGRQSGLRVLLQQCMTIVGRKRRDVAAALLLLLLLPLLCPVCTFCERLAVASLSLSAPASLARGIQGRR